MKWCTLLVLALILSGCSKEEVCNVDEWIGVYVGSKSCDGVTEEKTFAVAYELDNFIGSTIDSQWLIIDGERYTVNNSSCQLGIASSVGVDFGQSVDLDFDDGRLVLTVTYFGGMTCTWLGDLQ